MAISRAGITTDSVRLGTVLPLSGPMRPRGKPALDGMRALFNRINQEGGIHGRRLELAAVDDGYDPSRSASAVHRLVEDEEVFCLVGALGTATNRAAMDYVEASGVPVVASISGSSLLTTPPKRRYFGLQPNYVVEGTLLARYAVETLQAKRVGIFYSDDDFGQEGARAFQAELIAHQRQPVQVERGWQEGLAAEVIIERLQAAAPDTVLLYTYLSQAATLLKEAARQNFYPQWLGSYALWDPVLFDLAGPEAVAGMIVGQPLDDPLGDGEAVAQYREDLRRFAPDTYVGGYSASGYTAAAIVVAGLEQAGRELTREGLVTALEGFENWRGGLVSGISYSRYDRRGSKHLLLARAVERQWVTAKRMPALQDRLLNITAPLAMQVNILTRHVLEQMGKERIKQKAKDVARQCALYLRSHPGARLEDLQASESFRRIACQPVGLTGYTALYGPAPFPAMRIHPNPELIDVDLRTTDRPERFPDWWKLYQYSLENGGQEGGGFYFWADADGIARRKYQYFLPVPGTAYILGATTYLDEFFQPFEEAEGEIRRAVGDLTSEIARQILDPIERIMDGVDRVSEGVLNFQVEVGPAEEAQALAGAFNRMTRNLRELSERWAELNRELEARVAARTQELAEANRQLQISNRSLHEINRQLNEAKTAAERAQLDAEEADRVKGRFLSNISHELRAPLNAVINFSKLLLVGTEGPLTPGQQDLLQRMRDAGEHLLGLLNDMLDLSRIESGATRLYCEKTDLDEIIRGVMATAVGLTRDKAIQLRVEVEEGLPPVWVDRTRVRQVLLNLVANAAKFTEQGHITTAAVGRGDHVLVSVSDSGRGIAPGDREAIFQPYVKGAEEGLAGAGLGLNISRQLVEMHGGSIWVESVPGQGATFFFTLPLAVAEMGEPAPLARMRRRRSTQKGQFVLVVDGDRATYHCVRDPLQQQGYQVAGLTDPALLVAKLEHVMPVAVLVDLWQVEDMAEQVAALQQEWPQLPLLAAGYQPGGEQGLVAADADVAGASMLPRARFVEAVLAWLATVSA